MRCLIALCLLCLIIAIPIHAQDDSPYDIALQRIEEARISGATSLDLMGLGLTELPPEIGQLSSLQDLSLGWNRLMTLPPQIGQLSNLQSLRLSYNQLTTLPPEIGQLTNLHGLNLNHNQIITLPLEIGQLSNLQLLNLSNNELVIFPPQIGQLSNLQTLSLDNNGLNILPPEIGQLSSLCFLDLRDNNLRYLPTTLTKMSLQSEECIHGYSALYLYGNPLISPPPEYIWKGTPAVLDYLRNQAWYHMQRMIISVAAGIGLLVLLLLGFRWKQRGARKPKQKREMNN